MSRQNATWTLIAVAMLLSGLFFIRMSGATTNPEWTNTMLFFVLPGLTLALILWGIVTRFAKTAPTSAAVNAVAANRQKSWVSAAFRDTFWLLILFEIASFLFWVGLTLLN